MIGIAVLTTGLYSCSDEEIINLQQENEKFTGENSNYSAKSDDSSVSLRNPIDEKYYKLNVLSVNPLNIDSEYFEVKIMDIKDDKDSLVLLENAEIIVFKEEYRQSFSTGHGWTTRPGYWLDASNPHYDCWVYGIWWENTSTGESFFVEGSLEDRYMNNKCTDWGYKYA